MNTIGHLLESGDWVEAVDQMKEYECDYSDMINIVRDLGYYPSKEFTDYAGEQLDYNRQVLDNFFSKI